jgi:hypothetical protein
VSITFNAEDPRTVRAIELAANAGQWLACRDRDGQVLFGVPSQHHAGRYYLVSETSCDCPDFRRHGLSPARLGMAGTHQPCKHILAVRLHDELIRALDHAQARSAREPRRDHLRLVPSRASA